MFRPLQLLLPALIPSWGFFEEIHASPRIEYQLLDVHCEPLHEWQEFRPRAAQVSPQAMLRRLLWNPHWNETLFLISCAERIDDSYSVRSENAILECIVRDWRLGTVQEPAAKHVCFRLLFVQRQQLAQDIRFISRVAALPDTAA